MPAPEADHDHRLAVYGSLRPGESNHHELAGLRGDWQPGRVRGWLVAAWGKAAGYSGLRPDPEGPEVSVQVLTSRDLPAHWARLDEFEGVEYERVLIRVELDGEIAIAHLYALRPEPANHQA